MMTLRVKKIGHAPAQLARGLLLLQVFSLAACGGSNGKKSFRGEAVVDQSGGDGDTDPKDADGTAAHKDPHGNQNPPAPNGQVTVPPMNGKLATVGIRNFQQINATMAALTGIPMTTASIVTQFTALTTSLPTNNDVDSFNGSNQVGIFKLAVEYCDALVKDTTKRTAVFGNFNFAALPADAFNTAGKQQLADALIGRFWGKDMESLPPQEQSTGMLTALIDDIIAGKTAAELVATLTPGIATAACTAALAAAPVSLY